MNTVHLGYCVALSKRRHIKTIKTTVRKKKKPQKKERQRKGQTYRQTDRQRADGWTEWRTD